MKSDEESQANPLNPAAGSSKASDGVFCKGKYWKLWVISAILLLAFWSMFAAGSLTLTLSRISNSSSSASAAAFQDDLDVLEMEEREKVVRQMWDVYTHRRSTVGLPKFWQHAFEAAYEDLTADSAAVRDAAVSEIAKMSLRPQSTPLSFSTQRQEEKEEGDLLSVGMEAETERER
ncbi:unnamed protein product [Cuscuta campestris]|uniref:Uncharacterized protein n=1 Tax=Cuscuta campestris TaxID=132261 RepID=A0A484KJZ4_9ASTE|nr:unnamed protein product [Cuscuta campestris]